MQPEEVRGFLKEEEHFDDAFEGEFPSLFKMLIETDNRFYAKGRRESMCASEWMLAAYKCLGISLVEADGEISAGENRKIRAFIQKLEEYLETNLLSDKEKKLKKRRADNE